MADTDLSELQAALSVKIAGATGSGVEDNFLDVDASGRVTVKLNDGSGNAINLGQATMSASVPVVIASNQSVVSVSDAADGPVTPGTVASKSILIGGQFNSSLPTLASTQQSALQVDSSGRLIISPLTVSSVIKVQLQDNSGNGITSVLVGSAQSLNVLDAADGPVSPGTAALKSMLVGGQYNSTMPTLTTGQQSAVQLSSRGAVIVSGGAAVGNTPLDNPVSISGVDGGGLKRAVLTDTSGKVQVDLNDGSGNAITSTLTKGVVKRGIDTTVVDGPQVDSYQRMRIASQEVLFSNFMSNTNHPLKWNTAITGSATNTFNSTMGSSRLTTTTSSSDSIILQTKRYSIYTPGISYTIGISGVMGPKTTNLRKRFGYFDASDGFFFEITGTDYAVTLRTSTSGSPVDTRYAQSSWNLDKLDGTGASGVTLDTTKQNLYIADFVWQGTGRVRFGIMNGGTPLYFHEILNSNVSSGGPWMRSPSRPARIEMTNLGTTAGTNNMDIVCVDYLQESTGDQFVPYTFAATRGTTSVNVSTIKPLISITPNTTFNGLTNRVPIFPIKADLISSAQDILVQIFLNATLTGASFASPNSFSAALIDTSATAVSGGTLIYETYTGNAVNSTLDLSSLQDAIILGLNIAGSSGDILTVTATSLAGGTNTFCGLTWQEFQ